MKLNQVAEVIRVFYDQGRVKSTAQTIKNIDFLQMAKMAFAARMRDLYYANKKTGEGDEYYFFSGDLDEKEYELGEIGINGRRRAKITDEVVRLPKNIDVVNVYPISEGCGKFDVQELTQVVPGEENFYLGSEFEDFQFYVQKGRNIDTYNLPPSIEKILVERIFVSDDMEISLDIAFDIANEVLGVGLKMKNFPVKPVENNYSPQATELKRRLVDQQEQV